MWTNQLIDEQRIRGFLKCYTLYKSTFYLLTYNEPINTTDWYIKMSISGILLKTINYVMWWPKLSRIHDDTSTYRVCQKNPPWFFSDIFFQNSWEFLVQILQAYYTFLSTMDYKFLFNYLQLWQSYAILSATTIICSKCIDIGWNTRWVVALNMAL